MVQGVLFAADRTERAFSPEEMALFSAFADHASVSLKNPRICQESQDALGKLQDAYRTIENSSEIHRTGS